MIGQPRDLQQAPVAESDDAPRPSPLDWSRHEFDADAASATTTEPVRAAHWIDDWRPEDPAFWVNGGARIARRNLIFSILSEHIGFSVWSLWSVLVLFLGPQYGIDPAGKFLLTAVPTLVGAVLRIPYTFAVARFGGRNWTIFSALLLLVPRSWPPS